MAQVPIRRIHDYLWEIPKHGGMRVPGRIYATPELMADIQKDEALQQVVNVAHLPGIVGYALAMPDIHWGYGFPIGGVAAMDAEEGVISPGGDCYEVKFGVRFVSNKLGVLEIPRQLSKKTDSPFVTIPCRGGAERALPKLNKTGG